MVYGSDYRKNVQYELMLGREAVEAIAACPVGYLPVGCLERHGDHLPMGLDVIKAHRVCCIVAQTVGGVVFPAHFYAGIHKMTPEQIAKFTGQWGNIYTDASAKSHLTDVITQIAITGIKVLVLYTGHYPDCQNEMIAEIATDFTERGVLRVVPFTEPYVLKGDHAGISETSLMLYLDRQLVDMSRIGEANYRDHGWRDENSPEKATCAQGEAEVETIISHLRREIEAELQATD